MDKKSITENSFFFLVRGTNFYGRFLFSKNFSMLILHHFKSI